MEIQRTLSVRPLKYALLLKWCYMAKPSTKIKHQCLSQTGQSTTWWWKKAAMSKFQSVREAFQWWATFTRPGGKGGWGGCIRPIFLLNPIFDELKKNSVTVKNSTKLQNYPANIYLFKVNYTKRCEICPQLTIKIPSSGVFIINFEHILHLFLGFLLLTSNKGMLAG